jgi:TatD DNase family protein
MADTPLVDFHCHVDLYEDHADVIAESERLGIYTLAVTTTPKAWRRNQALAAQSRFVRVALGLHPQVVAERAGELPQWRALLHEARYVGEVGLDAGPRFFSSLEQQKEIFTTILRDCANQGGKILSIHSIRSVKVVLDMVETHLPPGSGHLVLHWFTGTKAEARRAVDLGCYFSINAEMLRTERHRELISTLPSDRLLTETDGPFTKTDGRTMRPADIRTVVAALADIRRVPALDMGELIARNLRSLVDVG